MPAPVIPVPAATLLLLRDRPGGGPEVLLIKRHTKSKFAAGDYVFAGGKIEADDLPEDGARFCQGLSGKDAAARLGGGLEPEAALRHWVGAIREAFEEIGMLFAYAPDGALVRWPPDARAEVAVQRDAVHRNHRAFFEMVRAQSLTLATDRLAYFAHWITPEEQPLRFDTRFFAAVAPPGQEPVVDGHEITDLRWLTPREAVAARDRGEITLRTPTLKNLELVDGHADAASAVAALGRREVATIRPRILQVDGKPMPVLPGDPRWY